MRSSQTSDLWWKNAVFYCLDVEKFFDGNGDGVGDFEGLTNRVDYLNELGVTCIWLMPFYPSPGKDDGYDVVVAVLAVLRPQRRTEPGVLV